MGLLKYQMFTFLVMTVLYLSVSGYPITSSDANLVNKDEKRYPNGTVVGKYSYTDEEGNPIHVKYYADDASYGVELKSVKMVNSNSNPLQLEKQTNFKHLLQSPGDPFDTLDTISPYELLKEKHKGDDKSNVGFEIFTQNELKTPEKCGKEKVKVYFNKDKRKTRNVPNHYETTNYCNKF